MLTKLYIICWFGLLPKHDDCYISPLSLHDNNNYYIITVCITSTEYSPVIWYNNIILNNSNCQRSLGIQSINNFLLLTRGSDKLDFVIIDDYSSIRLCSKNTRVTVTRFMTILRLLIRRFFTGEPANCIIFKIILLLFDYRSTTLLIPSNRLPENIW